MFTIKMFVLLCLILFIAPFCLGEKAKIDPQTLHTVFGDPQQYIANNGPLGPQAAAITPYNVTLEDPDYWDANDDFTPSSVDYDRFDWTLTKRVAVDSPGNFLLSPLGLKLALAILAEAATGNTQTELASVLNYDKDRNVVRRKFSSILSSLRADSNQYILNLGSRVYIYKNAEPRQRFAAIASEFYGTEIKRIDFDKPAVASKEINDWVSNITAGRIPNLVDADEVENMVVLILNTLYFKGNWRHQFAPNETKPAPFYLSAKEQKQIPFMHVREKFYFAESTKYDAKILRMPYLGHKFAMYLVVPNSIAGLSRVFDGLNDLRSEINYLQEKIVDVTIPKFQFDYTSQLDGVLRELGIRQAFEDTASFPGISRGQLLHQRLRVSKVLQRSGIEVNELGSIAYSATEIALVNKFGQDSDSYQELVANKPFLFYIEDEGTRQLLFTGRVLDPSKPDGTFKH